MKLTMLALVSLALCLPAKADTQRNYTPLSFSQKTSGLVVAQGGDSATRQCWCVGGGGANNACMSVQNCFATGGRCSGACK
jgi:hypothetical protein